MKIAIDPDRRATLIAILAALLYGSIFTASAQPVPPDRPEPPKRPDRPARPQPPDAARPERSPADGQRPGFGDPSLNEEQRALIRETMEASRKETVPLEEKMRTARRELQEAIHAEKLDEQIIREKAVELGKIEGDLAVIRAKAFAKIRPSLTPEQAARMKNIRPEFDRPRLPFAEGRPGERLRRGEPPGVPRGQPLPPGEDRGPDGTLPPIPKPRPPE